MGLFDKNFREIFSAQLFTIIGGLIAGVILAIYVDKIFLVPGMLIIIPGFMAMRGSISGTSASRISSGLFLGVINPSKLNKNIIKGNIKGSFALAMIVSLLLGLLAFAFNYIIMGVVTPKIILIPLLAGILSNFILNRLTIFSTIYLFKKGHDPNNISGPFITTIGDITSIVSLLIIILLIT